MKTSILAKRDHAAQKRIVAAMEELAERLGIEIPEQMQRQIGSPAERAMQQREGVADLLEAIMASVEQLEQATEAAQMPLEMAVFLVREANEDWVEAAKAATPEIVEETLQAINLVNAVSLVREASDEDLLAISGIGEATLMVIRERVEIRSEMDEASEEAAGADGEPVEDEPDPASKAPEESPEDTGAEAEHNAGDVADSEVVEA